MSFRAPFKLTIQIRGNALLRFQKEGGGGGMKTQTLKNRGKTTVGLQNRGKNVIAPYSKYLMHNFASPPPTPTHTTTQKKLNYCVGVECNSNYFYLSY